MNRYVLFLDEITAEMIPQVGGKGANLGLLTRWGFRVPAGFCVCSAALDDVLSAGQLRESIRRLTAGLIASDLATVEEITATIREMIAISPIPSGVGDAIGDAYGRLRSASGGDPLVAVRSSVGTRDGTRTSFPGQMDTYHNLRGIEQVIQGVRRCWASLWTVRAAVTRLKLGLGPDDVVIAPLVQQMVQSETAGVLFTADPITGDRNKVLISASYGLGEAVVAGNLTPDEYVFEKDTRVEIERRIGRKPFRWILDESIGSGTIRVDHGEEEALWPCLTDEQCTGLVEAGIRIEEKYGGRPQDVEWAFQGDVLYILQSRAVSAIPNEVHATQIKGTEQAPDAWEGEFDTRVSSDDCDYTSANISEVLPGVLTPLTSAGLKALDYGFWKSNFDLGLCRIPFPEDNRDLLFVGLFFGRPHLNLTRFREIASQIPGAATAELDRPLPKDFIDGLGQLPFRITPRSVVVLARFAWNSVKMLRRVPRDLETHAVRVNERYADFRGKDLSTLSTEALWEMIEMDESQDALNVIALHIDNSSLAVGFYELLRKLCARWVGDDTGALASRLVTGLATLESARPNIEIFRLHQTARKSEHLRDLFLRFPSEGVLKALEDDPHPHARGFRRDLHFFLDRYGYRGVNEAELMLPSWDRDPGFVLSMIQNLLRTTNPQNPRELERMRGEERSQAVADARSRLSLLRWLTFRWVLNRAQTFIAGRERNKALLMMGVHCVKNVYFELSARLHQEGILKEAQDLYFLTRGEIGLLCKGEPFDPYGRIPGRRAEWERNKRVRLPDSFRGRPVPLQAGSPGPGPNESDSGDVLYGLPISPGRVTGKARVITDPRTDAHIEEGEILVAPVTDAGWTPLFLLASAIVVDVGGLLSHGSIVAREYGIPGVINVLSGTRRIRTGQVITVDGDLGEVRIHGQ